MANEKFDFKESFGVLKKFEEATAPRMDALTAKIKALRPEIQKLTASLSEKKRVLEEQRRIEQAAIEEKEATAEVQEAEVAPIAPAEIPKDVPAPVVETVKETPVEAVKIQPIEEPIPTPVPEPEPVVVVKPEEKPAEKPTAKEPKKEEPKVVPHIVDNIEKAIMASSMGMHTPVKPTEYVYVTRESRNVERGTYQQRPYDPNRPRPQGGYPPRTGDSNKPRTFANPQALSGAPAAGKDNKAQNRKSPKDYPHNNNVSDAPKAKKVVKGKTSIVYDVDDYDEDGNLIAKGFKSRKGKAKSSFQSQVIKIEKAVVNTENVPIKVLSEKIGKSAIEIIKQLFTNMSILKTINDSLDYETAALISMELGVQLELELAKTFEDKLQDSIEIGELETDYSEPRPPIVTIMGHVDHGKTSLLDYIRKANVVSGEAGGITQHIGAYTASVNGKTVTFLDTPGHEAFTAMRARGAQVTDIAVIVVAIEDGVMPQTVEAINHSKNAGVKVVIAVNKIDKMHNKAELDSNLNRIKMELSNAGVLIDEWGGDDMFVPVSAKTGEGVANLLEDLVLIAEVEGYSANPKAMARGTIIEANLDKAKGPMATILVQNGTLCVGDYVVAGVATGRIRAMYDSKGAMCKKATPSMPVVVLGFSEVPGAGDPMVANKDEKLIKQVAQERRIKEKEKSIAGGSGASSLEDVYAKISSGQIKDLNIIIKTDVQGSGEAIKQELIKLSNEEVKINVIHCAVGAITESDIMLAGTSQSIVVGFNVRPDTKAKALAEKTNTNVRMYRVIYDLKNDIELALKGMLAPKFKETVLGKAEVRDIFRITGVGTIAGCYVMEGYVSRTAKLRLLRDNVVIFEGQVASLRRLKDDVKEVQKGFECGIGIANYNDIKNEDVIEFFQMEEITD